LNAVHYVLTAWLAIACGTALLAQANDVEPAPPTIDWPSDFAALLTGLAWN
jgi:hypothetical protein